MNSFSYKCYSLRGFNRAFSGDRFAFDREIKWVRKIRQASTGEAACFMYFSHKKGCLPLGKKSCLVQFWFKATWDRQWESYHRVLAKQAQREQQRREQRRWERQVTRASDEHGDTHPETLKSSEIKFDCGSLASNGEGQAL